MSTNNEQENFLLKSIMIYQLEKLSILLKEVQNLYSISQYYSEVIIKTNKIHLVEMLKVLQDELKKLHNNIYENSNYLQQVLDVNMDRSHLAGYKLPLFSIDKIIMIDANRNRISEYLKQLKYASKKLQQVTNDSFYQSKVKPNITKRFSSSNLFPILERRLTKRYKDILSNENNNSDNKSFYVTWGFVNEHSINYLLTYNHITVSYFYNDIMLINAPNISHELAHSLKESKVYTEVDKLSDEFSNELFKNKSYNILPTFQEEFTADVLALFYHGTSYVLSLVHLLLGKKLTLSINAKSYNKSFKINSWSFRNNDKDYNNRDIVFFRLLGLVDLLKQLKKSKKIKLEEKFTNHVSFTMCGQEHKIDIVNDITKLLYLIYPFDEKIHPEEKTLEQYYNNYQNISYTYQEDFKSYKSLDLEIYQFILEKYVSIYENNYNKSRKNKNKITVIPKYLNNVWKEWFKAISRDKVSHKIYMRMKIHRDVIETLINDNILKLKYIRAYKAEFIKQITPYEGKEGYKTAFGFYDYFSIKTLNHKYNPEIKILNKDQSSFQLNHSLMQITTPIKTNSINENYTSCVIQIDIPKSSIENNKTDIYDNLAKSIKTIYQILNANQNKFKKSQIFKTLGPNDLLVYIENISIENIYYIKGCIKNYTDENNNSSKQQNRTFTTILFDTAYMSKIKTNGNYFFQTDIFGHIDKEKIKHIKHIKGSENSTGVFDFRIKWEQSCSVSDIKESLKILGSDIIESNTYIELKIT